jgi:hypothetical protein
MFVVNRLYFTRYMTELLESLFNISIFQTFPKLASIIYRNFCKRKCGQKETPSKIFSPSRQCHRTSVGFGQGFLNKEQYDNPGNYLILFWLGSSWFLPVLSTEISIEGTVLLSCYNVIKNATEELKRLSQNVFYECVHQLFSC